MRSLSTNEVATVSLEALRAEGRGRLRRRLEVMVNSGVLGVAGAQKVYHDAFGDTLKAVKVRRRSADRLVDWVASLVKREGHDARRRS